MSTLIPDTYFETLFIVLSGQTEMEAMSYSDYSFGNLVDCRFAEFMILFTANFLHYLEYYISSTMVEIQWEL